MESSEHEQLERADIAFSFSCNMFCFMSRELKPALKIFGVSNGLSCKLNIGHYSFSCNMFWHKCRALKPALKIFGVSVGLSCKLNIGHFSFHVACFGM